VPTPLVAEHLDVTELLHLGSAGVERVAQIELPAREEALHDRVVVASVNAMIG